MVVRQNSSVPFISKRTKNDKLKKMFNYEMQFLISLLISVL